MDRLPTSREFRQACDASSDVRSEPAAGAERGGIASAATDIAPGRVDLWLIAPSFQPCPAAVEAVLDDAGRSRASAHGDPGKAAWDRRKQAALRHILGAYLRRAPADICFVHGPQGKPALVGCANLEFNISHSRGYTVIAVTRNGPLGVDLEHIRARARDQLALSILGPLAAARYLSLAPRQRSLAFSYAWSEREAFAKLLGCGIGDGWHRVRAAFMSSELMTPHTRLATRQVGGCVFHYLDIVPAFALVLGSAQAISSIRILRLCDLRHFLVLDEWAIPAHQPA